MNMVDHLYLFLTLNLNFIVKKNAKIDLPTNLFCRFVTIYDI